MGGLASMAECDSITRIATFLGLKEFQRGAVVVVVSKEFANSWLVSCMVLCSFILDSNPALLIISIKVFYPIIHQPSLHVTAVISWRNVFLSKHSIRNIPGTQICNIFCLGIDILASPHLVMFGNGVDNKEKMQKLCRHSKFWFYPTVQPFFSLHCYLWTKAINIAEY